MHGRIASPERARGSRRLHMHTACRIGLPARQQACPVQLWIRPFVGRRCACLIVRICSEFSRYWVFRSNRKVKRKPERKTKRKIDRKATTPRGITSPRLYRLGYHTLCRASFGCPGCAHLQQFPRVTGVHFLNVKVEMQVEVKVEPTHGQSSPCEDDSSCCSPVRHGTVSRSRAASASSLASSAVASRSSVAESGSIRGRARRTRSSAHIHVHA